MKKQEEIDYGNWVSASMMRMWTVTTLVAAALCVVCFLLFANGPIAAHWIIGGILLILTAGLLLTTVYFGICRSLFSYKGKRRIQSRILDYALSYLKFDHGRILDIGCGNGALSIKAAKKFPSAAVTGMDYWGSVWDFTKEQCEANAKQEGVLDRVFFRQGDAAHLDFPDESFDGVVSNFVFHEVKSRRTKGWSSKKHLGS
jgi:SAM-dependent methyltransferase